MTPLRHLNLHYAPTQYASRPDWERYAKWLRTSAAVSLSLAPEPVRTPLKARVFGRWKGDGYTSEKVCFESLPGLFVTGNLFRPLVPRRRCPVVLCPHGHWADGRLHDRDPLGSIIARCIQLARMGALVFSPDMVGYNDSCQLEHRFEGDPHWGLSVMALQTWNSVRGLDFLLSLPGADPRRVGVTGTSGGGTQTFALGAVDRRVTAAAPICMISYHMQGGCLCENAPLLRLGATSVDLARLFAPKPQFLGSCSQDWTRHTAQEELPALRNIYELYGAADRLRHHHGDFPHNYNQDMREQVYGFFNRHLFGAASEERIPELEVARPPHRERMVWWGREAPAPLPLPALRRLWRERAESALRPHLKDAATARAGLGRLLPCALGMTPASLDDCRREAFDSIRVEADGETLSILPRTPPPVPGAEKIRFFEAYNPTPFARRVHQILAAVANRGGRVRLCGLGEAGPACLAAAALSRSVKAVVAEMQRFDPGREVHWRRFMHTPAIRQVGGLAAVFALIGRRPVELRQATAEVLRLKDRYAR